MTAFSPALIRLRLGELKRRRRRCSSPIAGDWEGGEGATEHDSLSPRQHGGFHRVRSRGGASVTNVPPMEQRERSGPFSNRGGG